MQEIDAERRINILRGLPVEPHSALSSATEPPSVKNEKRPRERKRRRIAGEDDTDRDIRFATEDQAIAPMNSELQLRNSKTSDAPLLDRQGHINLFPLLNSNGHVPKNAEVEAEKAKRNREFEDQYTMRFSNAAGFKQSVGQKPWYHFVGEEKVMEDETPGKDVWGNEDPRRKEREKTRAVAEDPMAAMQEGVSRLRDIEREREKWKEDQGKEIAEMAKMQKHHHRKKRKEDRQESLDGFSLDDHSRSRSHGPHRETREGEHSRHRHRHRNHSNDDSRERLKRRRHHHDHHRRKSSKSREPVKPAWEAGPGGRYSSQFVQAS